MTIYIINNRNLEIFKVKPNGSRNLEPQFYVSIFMINANQSFVLTFTQLFNKEFSNQKSFSYKLSKEEKYWMAKVEKTIH